MPTPVATSSRSVWSFTRCSPDAERSQAVAVASLIAAILTSEMPALTSHPATRAARTRPRCPQVP